MAVKLQAVAFARSREVRWLRTFRLPDNTSAIGMNRRLGFVDEDRERWRSLRTDRQGSDFRAYRDPC